MRIMVRRSGALGDVVLTTPILRRLRRENPDAEIGVHTAFTGIFNNSPHKLFVTNQAPLPYPWTPDGGLDRMIDLDLAYEKRPTMHIVRAYMQAAFGDDGEPEDLHQEMFFPPVEPWVKERRVVAVHAAKAGWRNRTLPEATWMKVVKLLQDEGCFPILVGSMKDALPSAKCASFHSGDIMQQAAMIARCRCFIGSDSGLLHVAGATQTPIVGVFTSVMPAYRLPWRHGIHGWNCGSVMPNLDCVGCVARQPVPTTIETCERGDIVCTGMVSAETIVETTLRLIEEVG